MSPESAAVLKRRLERVVLDFNELAEVVFRRIHHSHMSASVAFQQHAHAVGALAHSPEK